MRQELIDLLRGELTEQEERELRQRLASDAALRRDLDELTTLFGLVRRGEEIEPGAAVRRRVLAKAARAVAPSVAERLRALPGLFAFRVRHSIAFRVAAVSVGAHLLLMAVLYTMTIRVPHLPEAGPIDVAMVGDEPEHFVPDEGFAKRLRARGYGHHLRIGLYGIEGQEETIARSLSAWASRQREDGSFGTMEQTGQVALAFLAEGDCSAHATPRGTILRGAVAFLLRESRRGEMSGAALAALVEDYVLSFEPRRQEQLAGHLRAIERLLPGVREGAFAGEAFALARMAGFPIPGARDLGAATCLFHPDPEALLAAAPSRLAAMAVLARGQGDLDAPRVREWLRPLMEAAQGGAERDPVALLTLQAPYRL